MALSVGYSTGVFAAHQMPVVGQNVDGSFPTRSIIAQGAISPGLVMPPMDSARGRKLFATKGCVVCHSVNHVGGEDAAALDASTMPLPMNPFEFSARMWRGAQSMVQMQMEELGEQIELTGRDLADIIAFAHSAEEQKSFSAADIPPKIKALMNQGDDKTMPMRRRGHMGGMKKQ